MCHVFWQEKKWRYISYQSLVTFSYRMINLLALLIEDLGDIFFIGEGDPI